ncbi:hypothetical protein WG66_007373 [Moniliophthora roreri]|nr:hypothetical protein WG66_007373 [Moniliophthora roreri]
MFSHLPTRRLAQLCLPIFSGLCSIASALVAVRSTSPVATGLSILSGLTSILTTVSALKSHNMWSKFKPRDLEEGSRARDEHSHQDHYNVASSRTSTSPQRSGARLNRRKIFSTRERSHSRESTSITRTYSDEWLPLEETRADNTSSSSSMLQSIAEEDTPVQDLPSQSNHATTSTGANLRRTSSCHLHALITISDRTSAEPANDASQRNMSDWGMRRIVRLFQLAFEAIMMDLNSYLSYVPAHSVTVYLQRKNK